MLLKLLLLGIIIVFCIDYSGFIEEADKMLTKLLHSKTPLHIPKPASCGMCMMWWCGLILLLLCKEFTFLNVTYVALISALTPEILSIIYFIKDLINKVFDVLERLLNIF